MNAETITYAILGGAIVGVIALVVGAAMASRAKAGEGGPHRKPRADVYTVMLLVSLAALIAAILCLYFNLETYLWEHKNNQAEQGLRAAIDASTAAVRHWFA